MAKINNYITDENITLGDKVIGSDADNDAQTKNYTVGGLLDFFQLNLDVLGISSKYRFEASNPLDINGILLQPNANTLVFSIIDLSGENNTTLFNEINDSKESVILSVASNGNRFSYFTVSAVVLTGLTYVLTVAPYEQLSTGAFVEGVTYNLDLNVGAGAGTPNLQAVTTEGNVTTLGVEAASFTTQSGTNLSESSPTVFSMLEYAGNKTASVSPDDIHVSSGSGGSLLRTNIFPEGVTIEQDSTSSKGKLLVDSVRFDVGVNSVSLKASGAYTGNAVQTLQDKTGDVALTSDIVAKISNRSTQHTSATLNTEFPLVDNSEGTFVIHQFIDGLATHINFYVRVTFAGWVEFSGSAI